MKSAGLQIGLVIAILAGVIVVNDGLFVVRVDRFAIVTEFGAPKRVLDEPGLYFKIPAIQEAVEIDKRIMSWDDQPQEVITLDKKRIYINSFARWKVSDPLKYYTAVREEVVAQMNLDKIIGGNIREIVSGNLLDTLVRDTNRALTYTTEDSERERATVELKDGRGRSAIVQDVVMLSRQELEDTFGIELIDVDIKQLNYTKSAQDATIRQMISEREKVAASYEAQGRKEADTIAGETQEEVLALRGSAELDRLRIEGEARAESSAVKARAFGQDPDFYRFIQSLELYAKGFRKETSVYLSTDSALMDALFYRGKGSSTEVARTPIHELIEELRVPTEVTPSATDDSPEKNAPPEPKAEKPVKAEEEQGTPSVPEPAESPATE